MYIKDISTHDPGEMVRPYIVFLALKVASDQNLPWQQAFKRPLKKDTVSTVVVSTSQLSVHLLACSFLRLSE